MTSIIPLNESDIIVWVCRQWNDWREAAYRLSDVSDLHWSRVSGGVRAAAPRAFVHGFVMCNAMQRGEIAHSRRHGEGPHRIKICIVKSSNREAWPLIERQAGPRPVRSG